MRRRSSPLRFVHVVEVLDSVYLGPKPLLDLQKETRISSTALYNTVLPSLERLGLIEIKYDVGRNGIPKKIVGLTEKGRRLIEALRENGQNHTDADATPTT
jgi:DNA-binding PadR family transcriptional regulator